MVILMPYMPVVGSAVVQGTRGNSDARQVDVCDTIKDSKGVITWGCGFPNLPLGDCVGIAYVRVREGRGFKSGSYACTSRSIRWQYIGRSVWGIAYFYKPSVRRTGSVGVCVS